MSQRHYDVQDSYVAAPGIQTYRDLPCPPFGHPTHLGRAALPTEIGPVIAFVGSRANSYMTGADINVDGGSDFGREAPIPGGPR